MFLNDGVHIALYIHKPLLYLYVQGVITLGFRLENPCSAPPPRTEGWISEVRWVGMVLIEGIFRYVCGSVYVQPRRMLVKSGA
jgi:hypothetical protein